MTGTRKTTADFEPEVLDAFDKYVHGFIDRRTFLNRVSLFAIGSLTAAGLLEMLAPNYADAQEVETDDASIVASHVEIPSPLKWDGYLVRPATMTETMAAVLVIHENRGRNPYIEDVARRLAKAGFIALAPDALTSLGGWPGNDDDGRTLQRSLDATMMFEHWVASFNYLKSLEDCNGMIGTVGFCYGGGVVNQLAVSVSELAAAVPFYGRAAKLIDVPRIRASLLIHSAELDKRLMPAVGPYSKALQAAGIDFESHIYAGAHHGFHNYSTPRYDEGSAQLAWQRTIEFFKTKLSVQS